VRQPIGRLWRPLRRPADDRDGLKLNGSFTTDIPVANSPTMQHHARRHAPAPPRHLLSPRLLLLLLLLNAGFDRGLFGAADSSPADTFTPPTQLPLPYLYQVHPFKTLFSAGNSSTPSPVNLSIPLAISAQVASTAPPRLHPFNASTDEPEMTKRETAFFNINNISSPIVFRRRGAAAFDTITYPLKIDLNMTTTRSIITRAMSHMQHQIALIEHSPMAESVLPALSARVDALSRSQAKLDSVVLLLDGRHAAVSEDNHSRTKRQIFSAFWRWITGAVSATGRAAGANLLSGSRQAFGSLQSLASVGTAQGGRFASAAASFRSWAGRSVTATRTGTSYVWQKGLSWAKTSTGRSILGQVAIGGLVTAVTEVSAHFRHQAVWNTFAEMEKALLNQENNTQLLMNESHSTAVHLFTFIRLLGLVDVSAQIADEAILTADEATEVFELLLMDRTPPSVLSHTEWGQAMEALANEARKDGHSLLTASVAELLLSSTTTSRSGDTISVSIDVPAARNQNIMTLTEFVPLPTFMSLPTSNHTILIHPPHRILALSVNDKGNPAYFRSLSTEGLRDCTRRADLLICDNARPARTFASSHTLPPEEQCIIALFSGWHTNIVQHCPFRTTIPFDDIVPVDDSSVIVVTAGSDVASINCADGNFFRHDLTPGMVQVDLRSDCDMTTRAGQFYAAAHPPESRAIHVKGSEWLSTLTTTIQAEPSAILDADLHSALPFKATDFSRLHQLIAERPRLLSPLSLLMIALGAAALALLVGTYTCVHLHTRSLCACCHSSRRSSHRGRDLSRSPSESPIRFRSRQERVPWSSPGVDARDVAGALRRLPRSARFASSSSEGEELSPLRRLRTSSPLRAGVLHRKRHHSRTPPSAQ